MATTNKESESWRGEHVRSSDGAKLGKLEHLYREHGTDRPTWGVVKSGRKKHFVPLRDAQSGDGKKGKGITVPVDKQHVANAPAVPADQELSPHTESSLTDHYSRRAKADETRDRQHEEHGGFKIGAAFFGWVVALGLAAILVALLGAIAAGAGFALNLSESDIPSAGAVEQSTGVIGIVGGALLLVILLIAYFGGGYVGGRLARFDGARQGLGVWLFGLVVSIALVILGTVLGSEYNLLQQIDVPTVPIPASDLSVGGIITLVAIVVGTVLAAILGGKAGERYHRKIDRAG